MFGKMFYRTYSRHITLLLRFCSYVLYKARVVLGAETRCSPAGDWATNVPEKRTASGPEGDHFL